MKNIVLIGISGSGKTGIGRRLAQCLSREFIDLDSLIEDREGLSIPQIFEGQGEEGFRRAETEAVKAVSGKQGGVIACGGGVVIKEINMRTLSQNGIVVFMNRPVKDILESVNLKARPLLSETPEKLYTLHNERLPLYEGYADFEVECQGKPDEILQQLIHISGLEQSEMKLAVIGDPIAHSLSPDIHIPALRPFFKSVSYERVRIVEEKLSQEIARIRKTGLNGFNVTMPHKEAIIPLLDGMDEEAAVLGSVNTIVNKDDELWGYNTDGEGFVGALASIGENFRDAPVTVIGSGGAAATIAMKAAGSGARELHMMARNQGKARSICRKIEGSHGARCLIHSFPESGSDGIGWESHIIINATPLGMHGMKEDFPGFAFLDRVKENTLLCDLIYSPAKTRFLIEGEQRGLRTLGGINMLIEQALESDRLYIGAKIMREKAYKRIIDNLRGKVEGI